MIEWLRWFGEKVSYVLSAVLSGIGDVLPDIIGAVIEGLGDSSDD